MRNIFMAICVMPIFFSCETKTNQAEKVAAITDTAGNYKIPDSINIKTDSHYFWTSETDQKNRLVMKKEMPISIDSLTPASMIKMINTFYPEVAVEFIRISNDSIFVKIPKSIYLTERMGSSGAEAYLAELTYNLSELKNINYVDVRFKAGDHASPATFTRTDFIHEKN